MKKYLLEFSWGTDNPVHEEMEVEADDIAWTLDQIARNRGNIKFNKVKQLENE